jgi:anti-sigma factor RsiW
MSRCARARDLFGPYWDDETTRAEREWLDAHFATCAHCRADYEELARTLAAMATLPREEAVPDLAARALAAARLASPARDVVFVRESPAWLPLATAAAAVLLTVAALTPWLVHPRDGGVLASREAQPTEARGQHVSAPMLPGPGATATVRGTTAATVVDSLFDHTDDVDFVLDPVTLRRGRAHTTSHLPKGIQGEQAVITF